MIALMCSVFFVGAIQNARTSYMGNTYKPEKPYVVTDMLDFKTPITTTPEFSK